MCYQILLFLKRNAHKFNYKVIFDHFLSYFMSNELRAESPRKFVFILLIHKYKKIRTFADTVQKS